MPKRLAYLVLIAVCSGPTGSDAYLFGQTSPSPSDLKTNFLNTYRPYFDRIKTRYENIEIVEIASGEAVKTMFKQDQIELRFRARNGSTRTDATVQGELKKSRVNTPNHRFEVITSKENPGMFVLTRVDMSSFDQFQKQVRNDLMYLPFVPYCWLNFALMDYLSDAKTTIHNVTHSGDGQSKRCVIETK